METNKRYQQRELKNFLESKHSFFDTVKEFSESLEQMDILEQIEWIENGSFGSGACFALQQALNSITPRTNGTARVGRIVLHAFYGKDFRYWNKLSNTAKESMDKAVKAWMKQEHTFAQELE